MKVNIPSHFHFRWHDVTAIRSSTNKPWALAAGWVVGGKYSLFPPHHRPLSPLLISSSLSTPPSHLTRIFHQPCFLFAWFPFFTISLALALLATLPYSIAFCHIAALLMLMLLLLHKTSQGKIDRKTRTLHIITSRAGSSSSKIFLVFTTAASSMHTVDGIVDVSARKRIVKHKANRIERA